MQYKILTYLSKVLSILNDNDINKIKTELL
jgi:hypothetical protein